MNDAAGEKEKLIDQISDLQFVLDGIRRLVEDKEANASFRFPGVVELLSNPSGLPRCVAELNRLNAKFKNKPGRTERTAQALIWPLTEGYAEQTLEYLGQFQQLLSMTVNVDQAYVAPAYLPSDPNLPDRHLRLATHNTY